MEALVLLCRPIYVPALVLSSGVGRGVVVSVRSPCMGGNFSLFILSTLLLTLRTNTIVKDKTSSKWSRLY